MGALLERYAPALEPGEQLRGVCLATQAKTFSGRAVALATTDRRLLLIGLDRRGDPAQAPRALDVVEAQGDGLAGWSLDPAAWLVDDAGVQLKLRLRDGEKLKYGRGGRDEPLRAEAEIQMDGRAQRGQVRDGHLRLFLYSKRS